ncbi:YidC/Oxa1 family membrane protein insertase [Senegalia massiliensis]|uniref:YidC/Oxa1 family membrane protein insertase n=1 Tax=Senegalia massiliensis TaxID=1720316 RepID=UPI0010320451|nr:YidC/Oxa1 family membrane protein insertase [Senegalia massiliensis]
MNILQTLFDTMNSFTNDYGITIILVTVLFNLVLLPLTIKQRKSMKLMEGLTEKTNELKKKYKNDEEKLNKEVQKLYAENSKSFLGILLFFIQMPAFIAMYRLFTNNVTSVSTVLFPWLNSLSVPDPYFILPLIYILVQVFPNILSSINIIKNTKVPKISKQIIIVPAIMAILLVSNMPSALGIYFVTSAFIQSTQKILL